MGGANTQHRVDVGIITIRDDELRAVLAAFPRAADPGLVVGRRHYNMRLADAGGGAVYRVAIVRQLEQGNGEALDAARDLLEELAPRLLLVVGVAGGVPHDDFTLGDVVLSTRVHDYSVEARKENEAPAYALSGGPIDRSLAAAVVNLPAREADLGAWTEGLPAAPPVDFADDRLYGPESWRARVKASLAQHFGAGSAGPPTPDTRAPVYVAGVIATSDRLVKDTSVLVPWLETSRHILAIEMESGGVYRAGRDRAATLAIRGISDIVGLRRDDRWTRYACATAASFARAFLCTTPIPPEQAAGFTPPVPSVPSTAPAAGASSPSPVVTLNSLRKILLEVLRGASTFDAFCLDHFREVYQTFSDGMDRDRRTNLLLERIAPNAVASALQKHDPGRFAAFAHLLEYEAGSR